MIFLVGDGTDELFGAGGQDLFVSAITEARDLTATDTRDPIPVFCADVGRPRERRPCGRIQGSRPARRRGVGIGQSPLRFHTRAWLRCHDL